MRSNLVLITVIVLLLAIVGLIIYLGAPNLRMERMKKATPKLIKAWVLSQIEGEDVASTDVRIVPAGTRITLYALVKAEDPTTHETFFVTKAPRVEMYGKPLSPDQIRDWDTENWLPISLFWYRVDAMQDETGALKFNSTYLADWKNEVWSKTLTDADLKPVGVPYHEEPFGRAFYALEARIPLPNGKTLTETRSAGETELYNDPTTPSVCRIVVYPDGHYGEVAKGYYNVPYLKIAVPDEYIRHFVALHPYALPLAAYELKHHATVEGFTLETLEAMTEKTAENVICDIETGECTFSQRDRRGRETREPVRFGEQVNPGDVLMAVDRACLVMEDRGPDDQPNGELDTADLIICGHPDDKPPYPLVQRLESGFPINGFDIRRFKPGENE